MPNVFFEIALTLGLSFSLPASAGIQGFLKKPIKCALLLLNKLKSEQKNIDAQIYSKSTGIRTGKILYLSVEEYHQRVLDESIEPDTILFLDDIDLEVELPLVAGVILTKALPSEGTHVQVLAEKMGIPMLFSPGLNHTDPFFTPGSYFSLNTSPPQIIRWPSALPAPVETAVLPEPYDRAGSAYWTVAGSHARSALLPREIVGDKFFALARFRSQHPELVPPIYSITAKFFETLKASKNERGLSLGKAIERTLSDIETRSEEDVKVKLAHIRKTIEYWRAPFSARLNTRLKLAQNELLGTSGKISVRSNADGEDLLAAGLYESKIAYGWDELDLAARKVLASLYNYRAYKIRRAWGLLEKNVSMPILVHHFIGEEAFNGVARFKMGENNSLIAEFNLVEGSDYRATNPNRNAKFLKIIISDDPRYNNEPPQTVAIRTALGQLFTKVRATLIYDLTQKVVRPQNIDLEILLTNASFGNLTPWVLQYKTHYNREIVMDVLKGKLKRTDLDQNVGLALPLLHPTFALMARSVQGKRLQDTPITKAKIGRFGLIYLDGKYEILVFQSLFHSDVNDILKSHFPKAQWVTGGYISANKGKIFIDTFSITQSTRPLSENQMQIAFIEALNAAASAKKAFKAESVAIDSRYKIEDFRSPSNLKFDGEVFVAEAPSQQN
jgi:hypothetical protein